MSQWWGGRIGSLLTLFWRNPGINQAIGVTKSRGELIKAVTWWSSPHHPGLLTGLAVSLVVLAHGITSFFYTTGILALAINLVAGLLGGSGRQG